jgi:hypothetical protein
MLWYCRSLRAPVKGPRSRVRRGSHRVGEGHHHPDHRHRWWPARLFCRVLTIGASKFFIGDFINSVVSFVIIAAVIYFLVVVPTSKLIERMKSETPPSATLTRECPECLSKIPVKARRCAFCTTEIDSSAEMLNATNSSALSQPTTRG